MATLTISLSKEQRAFIDAEVKMARDNKSNVAPTPWNVWLFASHPPTVERIQMAEEWRRRHARQGDRATERQGD